MDLRYGVYLIRDSDINNRQRNPVTGSFAFRCWEENSVIASPTISLALLDCVRRKLFGGACLHAPAALPEMFSVRTLGAFFTPGTCREVRETQPASAVPRISYSVQWV